MMGTLNGALNDPPVKSIIAGLHAHTQHAYIRIMADSADQKYIDTVSEYTEYTQNGGGQSVPDKGFSAWGVSLCSTSMFKLDENSAWMLASEGGLSTRTELKVLDVPLADYSCVQIHSPYQSINPC